MKTPVIYSKDLIKAIIKLGFIEIRQKGSHKTFSHPDGRILTIPYHTNRPLPIGLLHKIIKEDLKTDPDNFFEIIK